MNDDRLIDNPQLVKDLRSFQQKARPQKHRKPDPRRHPGQEKGPCFNFLHGVGVTAPKNEEQAAAQLVEIHKNWREREQARVNARNELPAWKRWVISFLNLPV